MLDDKNLFLDETFDFEEELVQAIGELTEEEKLLLLQSEDLPECILEVLERNSWHKLPKSA